MALPSGFAQLSVPEQVFVALNRERVDRGLAPFVGMTAALDANAQKGAGTATLPPRPGRDYPTVDAEWIGAVDNGLDADYQWIYNDGPNGGVPNCTDDHTSGCWVDRKIVLERFASRHLVMGVAYDPTGDTSPGDRGGSSLAATLAVNGQPGPYLYSWDTADWPPRRRARCGLSGPFPRRSRTPALPTRRTTCLRIPTSPASVAGTGLDNSSSCINAAP